jgi:hypothetical protein
MEDDPRPGGTVTKTRWPREKRWPKLIGEGTWENPRIIIRWNGHEFGHLPTERHDILLEHMAHVEGVWVVIDEMLRKLHGELTEEERLAWYEEHADDLVEITTQPGTPKEYVQEKSVYRWSDEMRFRTLTQRFDEHVIPELRALGKARQREGIPPRRKEPKPS